MASRLGLSACILTALATTHPAVERATDAAEPRAKIQFNLLDRTSAQPVPAMVCIRNLQDSSVRRPNFATPESDPGILSWR